MDLKTTFLLFKERIQKKINLDKPIGNVIMNQKIISGIGNYLRADILWCAKINPFRKVKDLTDKELYILYHYSKVLTWGEYDKNKGIKLGIIKKTDKLPKDYGRDFFIYQCKEDIYNNPVSTDKLSEGSEDRTIFYVKQLQK